MGPIQQATNQLLQAGAATATVGKHFVNQKKRDALSALETTANLAKENKDVSRDIKISEAENEVAKQAYEQAGAAKKAAQKNFETSQANIDELESNPHPKRANGQFMSGEEKKSKLEELYEKHKLIEQDKGVAEAAFDKSALDYATKVSQWATVSARYDYLQQKKSIARSMMPKADRTKLDKSFKSSGDSGLKQGELWAVLKSKYKGEIK